MTMLGLTTGMLAAAIYSRYLLYQCLCCATKRMQVAILIISIYIAVDVHNLHALVSKGRSSKRQDEKMQAAATITGNNKHQMLGKYNGEDDIEQRLKDSALQVNTAAEITRGDGSGQEDKASSTLEGQLDPNELRLQNIIFQARMGRNTLMPTGPSAPAARNARMKAASDALYKQLIERENDKYHRRTDPEERKLSASADGVDTFLPVKVLRVDRETRKAAFHHSTNARREPETHSRGEIIGNQNGRAPQDNRSPPINRRWYPISEELSELRGLDTAQEQSRDHASSRRGRTKPDIRVHKQHNDKIPKQHHQKPPDFFDANNTNKTSPAEASDIKGQQHHHHQLPGKKCARKHHCGDKRVQKIAPLAVVARNTSEFLSWVTCGSVFNKLRQQHCEAQRSKPSFIWSSFHTKSIMLMYEPMIARAAHWMVCDLEKQRETRCKFTRSKFVSYSSQ